MKKAFVASLLGIAAFATSSHGQGYIIMQNYDLVNGTTPVFSAVTYASDAGFGKAGQYVGASSGFTIELLFSLNGGNTFSVAAGSQTGFFQNSSDGGTPTTDGAGTFFGPTVTVPGYTSGPAVFEVHAFSSIYSWTGTSAPFTINSLETSPLLPPDDLLQISGTTANGLQPFSVGPVPEPTVFALAGLGAAALIAIRRKK